jgi:hypothetical protein
MSSSQKKPSILGSNMLSFIANMVNKNSETTSDQESTDQTAAVVVDQHQTESNKVESQSLATHLNKELNIISDEEVLMDTKAELDMVKSNS